MSILSAPVGVALAGMLLHFAQPLYPTASRLLVSKVVSEKLQQREALGWLRTVNNGAQIFSYSLSWILSASKVSVLLFLDGATSMIALIVGARLLPKDGAEAPKQGESSAVSSSRYTPRSQWFTYGAFLALLTLYSCLFEIFLVSTAAQMRLRLMVWTLPDSQNGFNEPE